ncbi:MAG: hypothetical protein MJA30_17405 [Cytophagales bacterium]|nr:hypothetical protein [Cytophagales bacterium]
MKKLKHVSVFMIVFSALAFACDTESVEPLNTGEDDDDVVIMSDPND